MTILNTFPGSLNQPVVSVTVCPPGSGTCATIPNVLVDTGSSGLRLLSSSLTTAGVTLPAETSASTGDALAECQVFGIGYTWGSVSMADVHIGGELAHSVPIQVINNQDSRVPAACTDFGAPNAFQGYNGILGVDPLLQDCGDGCAVTVNNGSYFDCGVTTCTATAMPLAQQVSNAIAMFGSDNSGIILSMPALTSGFSISVNGTLTFGLDTQSNNTTEGVTMMNGDSNAMTASYEGIAFPNAIIDSGSNFELIAGAPLPTCQFAFAPGVTWYCPEGGTSQSAIFTGDNGAEMTVNFDIADANILQETLSAYHAYAGIAQDTEIRGKAYLDLGMPFFYGHNVYLRYPVNGAVEQIGVATNTLTSN